MISKKFAELDRLTGIASLARRFFIMNAFDGMLTIIGVLIGAFVTNIENPKVIIMTGFSTSLAMGISGIWGAYLTESAESQHELNSLEQQTLTDLSKTRLGQASRQAVIIVTLVDGLAPFLSAMISLIPFFFVTFLPSIRFAYYLSFGLIFLMLFCIGIFLGRLTKEHILISGAKMLIAGISCIILVLLVKQLQ